MTGAIRQVEVAEGWASNSVNAVIFRKNALVSFRDTQFIAFYDAEGTVVLGKRRIGAGQWQLKQTPYKGNVRDAHNCISIMVDGAGYLHMAWDHHNDPLHYCRSTAPGSLELTAQMPMTGRTEGRVSYPEFYRMPDGDLLFFYRNGESGNGNLVINRYGSATGKWSQLQNNLIDGEGLRNAYWQACVDGAGTIHVSWVWRESPDVASNHDLGYARSRDCGMTWEKSTGEKYSLPINAANAEYACRIPQNSELINQTSMTTNAGGNPYIATYWSDPGGHLPQYRVVYRDATGWKTANLGFRETPFSLSGGGTKRIPISRPQLLAWGKGKKQKAALIFRDEERGSRVSAAICKNLRRNKWKIRDLTLASAGSWEPTFDTELWKEKGMLNLFLQNVTQIDGEGRADVPPQMIKVLEWNDIK